MSHICNLPESESVSSASKAQIVHTIIHSQLGVRYSRACLTHILRVRVRSTSDESAHDVTVVSVTGCMQSRTTTALRQHKRMYALTTHAMTLQRVTVVSVPVLKYCSTHLHCMYVRSRVNERAHNLLTASAVQW